LSISASAAILFVAFVVCFAALFGAMSDYQEAVDAAAGQQRQRVLEAASTSIALEQVDGSNDTFVVVNNGQTVLGLSDFEVLVDGRLLASSEVEKTVLGHEGSELVFSGDRVMFRTTSDLDGHRVMVVTSMGISTTYDPN